MWGHEYFLLLQKYKVFYGANSMCDYPHDANGMKK